jgi:serine/threonine protein kinase
MDNQSGELLHNEFNVLQYLHNHNLQAIIPAIYYFNPNFGLSVEYFQDDIYLPLNESNNIDPKLIFEYLHAVNSTGIIHCDLKPEHVLVNIHNSNDIKIIDWNLAHLSPMYSDNSTANEAVPNRFIGSLDYSAISIHLGYFPTPLTDLESLLYIIIQLSSNTQLVCQLTWLSNEDQHLANDITQFSRDDLMRALDLFLDKESKLQSLLQATGNDDASAAHYNMVNNKYSLEKLPKVLEAKQQFIRQCANVEIRQIFEKIQKSISLPYSNQLSLSKELFSNFMAALRKM